MTRQEFMLAVLAAGDGEGYKAVQVQKLFFLLDRMVPVRIGGPRFNFQPHDYGPFDKDVYEELRALAAKGLVAIDSPTDGPLTYRATHKGMVAGEELLGQFDPGTADYIRRLLAWVRSQSFTSLVSAVHQVAPDMAVNRIFKEAQ